MPDFQRLRELLLSDEQAQLAQLQAQLHEVAQKHEKTFERLPPELVTLLHNDDGRIADALVKPLSRSLAEAVRQQPQSIVDALFPVIGPSIRKAIAEAMRDLVGNLNQAVESSLSLQGLRWRIEARRSGVPYAQVVLRHLLRFHIDHVFLIEPGSGLVLHHESAPDLPAIDADAVAGMLSAINDFVHDSVARDSHSALNSATVGEHVLWLIEGPRANLACFIRGAPPLALQAALAQRLEQWHGIRDHGDPHAPAFTTLFAIGDLEHAATADNAAAGKPRSANWPVKVLLLLLVLGIAAYWWRSSHWHARIENLRTNLSAHAGFVLTGIESRPYREVHIHGLLDPVAEPLQADIDQAELGAVTLDIDTQPFVSAAPALALKRAKTLLQPSPDLQLELDHGLLKLSGIATPEWIASARERAPWIAGINAIDATHVIAPDNTAALRAELDHQLKTIANLRVHLMLAKTELDPAYPDELSVLTSQLKNALILAAQLKLEIHIDVYGLTDVLGEDTINRVLREKRAAWLIEKLIAEGIAADRLHASAIPDTLPQAQRLLRAAAVFVSIGADAAR
ncbi:hypothetical protein ELE36_16120 [Pseudolysobacter antarcticus]|uniref:Flagellar motor protein MotB n=1 Tax=Pseudolysobacter antarcticus TaxID=2511995 RepID=A0A411HMP8_9GAMM|nr:hypothetical protein [Pseudolysobacter antarcticus]QBB71757.1 hypothetical protein ELE36_16120 [Pseudolysobacter antarcticus]